MRRIVRTSGRTAARPALPDPSRLPRSPHRHSMDVRPYKHFAKAHVASAFCVRLSSNGAALLDYSKNVGGCACMRRRWWYAFVCVCGGGVGGWVGGRVGGGGGVTAVCATRLAPEPCLELGLRSRVPLCCR